MKVSKNKNKKVNKKKSIKERKSFKSVTIEFLKNNYIYIIMVLLVIARVWLGYAMGAWYGFSETYDDVAMMQGLSLKRLIEPTNLALIKDLSFSVFLGFSAITNLPYTVVLSGFWALAALTAWLVVRKVTDKKWVQLSVFAYVLFLPIAFTSWGGLRVYRNAIIAPCIIMTFSLALMLIINLVRQKKMKKTMWLAILTGLSFAFTYFLKEDGLWLKVCMLVILLVCAVIIGYRLFKEKVKGDSEIKKALKWMAICLIPFVVLFVCDNVYRGINYAFFDVYEVNTRTEGELGKFVENIYKIDSPNRTSIVWAPYDAIEKAFEVSPTLSAHPELLEEIMTTGWNEGGIISNPIKRDFLGWVMRSELADAGLWTSEGGVNSMFKQVNQELDDAFRNGTLKKTTGRIQLLSSVGGYKWEEIENSNLLEQVGASLGDAIWLINYDIGFSDSDIFYGTKGKEWDGSKVNKVLHMDEDLNVVDGRGMAHNVVNIVYIVYRVVNTILIVLMIIVCMWVLIATIRNRKNKIYYKINKTALACIAVGVVFLGVTVAYSFATAWFFIDAYGVNDFSTPSFIFYRVGVPALLTISFASTFVGGVKLFERKSLDKVSSEV